MDRLRNRINYFTQYLTSGESIEGYINAVINNLDEDVNINDLEDFLDRAMGVDDEYNHNLFTETLINLNQARLERMLDIQAAILDGDVMRLLLLVGHPFIEMDDIATGDIWQDLVDESLRAEGLQSLFANVVKEVKKLDSNTLYEINGYLTGFIEVNVDEILNDTYYLKEILEYILEG